MIVVDTNVIAYLILPGPNTELTRAAAEKDIWCAPLLWRSEFRSVLTISMRQSRIQFATAAEAMARAERLLFNHEYSVRSAAVLNCIARSTLSAYDCEFVGLAEDFGIRLLTSDEAIIREFPRIAIHLRDYVR